MSNAIHIGGSIDSEGLSTLAASIERVLAASFAHRSSKVTVKALETLQDGSDVSVSNVTISNCSIVLPDEKEVMKSEKG